MQEYDVVVIGAGNAGLSAACKMAKSGKKTLLLERHNLPGGCATSFRRGRFEFETSLHELCDYGPPSDPGEVRKLLNDEYGLDIRWCEVPDTFRVIGKSYDGSLLDVTMPAGQQAFIDKMEAYVPGSRQSMENFFELAEETLAAIGYISASSGKADSNYLKEHYPNFLRTAAHTTNKVFRALKIPRKAQEILNTYWSYLGVDTERLSFMHYAAMVHKYINRSAYIPELTSHGLSLALLERFREMGGEVWFHTEATRILFSDDQHVCGVETNQGSVACRYVISNVNPHTVYANMLPAEIVPERELKLANARKHSGRAFVLYLGLNKSAEELGISDYSIFLPPSMDSAATFRTMNSIADNDYSIFLCYNVVNPKISPPGTAVLSFTTFYSEDCWGKVNPEDYVKTKNGVARRMIEKFEATTGIAIQDAIEEVAVATPWTFARYIGTPQGTMYGYETNEWDSMMARLMMLNEDYPIKGLKFAGAFGPRGDGYSATYICGELIAKLTLKDMAEEAK